MMVSNRNLLFQGVIFKCYVSFREGTSLNRVNVKSWETNPYGKARLPILTRWLCRPASVAVHWCLTPGTTRIRKFPQNPGRKYTTWKVDGATPMYWFIMAPYQATFWELRHLLSLRCTWFLSVFWGWRWKFKPKELELQERRPRNMMDNFSLIGLGCFIIFKGSALWMPSRGLTIQPLFEWVVNSTTSKNGDLGCSVAGFKYPVPTCYTPTSSFILVSKNVRRYAKSLSGVVFFLCTRYHPSKG